MDSIYRYKLHMVPDLSWFKGKIVPETLLCCIDSKSYDDCCLTINDGNGLLAFEKLNSLGLKYKASAKPRIGEMFSYEKKPPVNSCKFPIWEIKVGSDIFQINKSQKDQWEFFNFINKHHVKPFCIFRFKSPILIWICKQKEFLIESKKPQISLPCYYDENNIRSFKDLIKESKSDNYALPNTKEINSLIKSFKYTSDEIYNSSMKGTGTSFPEQAILFYVKQVFGEDNVISRDRSYGKEIDIFIKNKRVGIEYNGSYWHNNKSKDDEKYNFFKEKGIRIIEVYESDTDNVKDDYIYYNVNRKRQEALNSCINNIFKILNIKAPNIDIDNDEKNIYAQYKNLFHKDSIGAYHPDLLFLWSKLNEPLTPFEFKRNSSYNAWLECPYCTYSWKLKVSKINYYLDSFGEITCPHCGNYAAKQLKDKSIKGNSIPLFLLLPHADVNEYIVTTKVNSQILHLNNGIFSHLVIGVKASSLIGDKPLLYNDDISEYPNVVFTKLLKYFKYSKLESWWHCITCGKTYVETYYDYFTSEICRYCGSVKKSHKDIKYLNKDYELRKNKELESTYKIISEWFKRYKNTLKKNSYPTIDNFVNFIYDNRLTSNPLIHWRIKNFDLIIIEIDKLKKEFEQKYLNIAFDFCIKNNRTNSDKNLPLVRDIKYYMPRCLKSSTSRIIKESSLIKLSKHGVIKL